jgi:RNA polymerase sigma factor (sigma-70 family)
MTPPESAADSSSRRSGWFATTHWTTVLIARDEASADALESLCANYWYPLYAYVRRRGHPVPEAQDLTQGFFARLLERNYLRDVQTERGRFRSFLLGAFRHYLANEWDRARAVKRGGGCRFIPLDEALAESRFTRELADDATPERLFERAWALVVLEKVRNRLHAEYQAAGKGSRFSLLEQSLPGGARDRSQAELGRELGLSESAVKSEVHRLRRRYAELVRLEIAHTVSDPDELDDELRHLIEAVGNPSSH